MNPHDFAGRGPHTDFASPVLITLGLIVLLAGALWFLWSRGLIPALGRASGATAEDSARRILAERFATGTIGSEEFMERASLLNWTPGLEQPRRQKRRSLR